MTQQPSTPTRNVALAGILVVLSLAVFAAAFYIFDGVGLVTEIVSGIGLGSTTAPPSAPVASSNDATLTLPAGVTKDVALRLWQEQVDSKETIDRLASGEIQRLVVRGVAKRDDGAVLKLQVFFDDGTTLAGDMGLVKFGANYFVTYVSSHGPSGRGLTPLPAVNEVDAPLLTTILAEQVKSRDNLREYVEGKVLSVEIGEPEKGPNTITLPFKMTEDHEIASGNIVLIGQDVKGERMWFLARFNKTGSIPVPKQ